jgi:hypothetical protein
MELLSLEKRIPETVILTAQPHRQRYTVEGSARRNNKNGELVRSITYIAIILLFK